MRCCDGDSVTLECHVEGKPDPLIIWEKDGRKLSCLTDIHTQFDGRKATLSINHVFPEDEGEYTCIASNTLGRTYTAACIIVDVPEEKENLLSRQLLRPGGLLSAHSTPMSTPRSTPARSVSPMHHISHHRSSSNYPHHPKRHKFSAPKFYSVPHNRVAEEGESVRFQCAIAGHPVPWATWDKDGVIVTPSKRLTIKERDDLRVLELDEVTQEDAGLYRITLENDYGRIEATARLDIISHRADSHSVRSTSAPLRRSLSSSRRIMGYSTKIGGRLALAGQYRATSIPSKKMYHNGQEIFDSDRIQTHIDSTNFSIVINNVTIFT